MNMNIALPSVSQIFFLAVAVSCRIWCTAGLGDSHGPEFESIKRFPHFVTISTQSNPSYASYDCTGSIIARNWILTAFSCVRHHRFTVHFLVGNLQNLRHSYSLSLDDTSVLPYPTGYDDIALVKLPITLGLSEALKPIRYYTWNEAYHEINRGFTVMPGFNLQQGSTLTYGMYKVLCRQNCKHSFGNQYDEFWELCSTDWSRSNQLTLSGALGSGLIQGWPRDPHLIGIFIGAVYNNGNSGLVFVKLSKYTQWIEEITMDYIYTTTPLYNITTVPPITPPTSTTPRTTTTTTPRPTTSTTTTTTSTTHIPTMPTTSATQSTINTAAPTLTTANTNYPSTVAFISTNPTEQPTTVPGPPTPPHE